MIRDRGLTLIELVAAMAVFALVAIMGLQALTGSLRMRDALSARADGSLALEQALALLRHDMNAALPMLFFPPGGAPPQSALRAEPDGFALSRGGLPDGAMGRIDWRLEGDTLSRRVWPTLTPANPGQISPAAAVLTGVTALEWRSHWPGSGWTPGLRAPTGTILPTGGANTDSDTTFAAPETYSDTLPDGIELTLTTRDFGRITLVESLK